MILVIQTNIANQLAVWIFDTAGRLTTATQANIDRSRGTDGLIKYIDRMIKRRHIKISHIKKIVVVRGPGSFTAVRIGLIAANTIGWLYDIPVIGVVQKKLLTTNQITGIIKNNIHHQEHFTQLKPWYGKAPNITRSTKRR